MTFADIINTDKNTIASHRRDLTTINRNDRINKNASFEYIPEEPNGKGVLLLHGLLESSFSMHDMGKYYQSHGYLVRALLLPGHGTHPSELIRVRYQQWTHAVGEAMDTFPADMKDITLVGISTGALLALHYALTHPLRPCRLILLAPALKIKSRLAVLTGPLALLGKYYSRAAWLSRVAEDDEVKYRSLPCNAVYQVYKLARAVKKYKLTSPMMMILTADDETIDTAYALRYFKRQPSPQNRLLYYTTRAQTFTDPRIRCEQSAVPQQHIINFSHVSLAISPDNPHYGKAGNYTRYTIEQSGHEELGAINEMQQRFLRVKRSRLYYNPFFKKMMAACLAFCRADESA